MNRIENTNGTEEQEPVVVEHEILRINLRKDTTESKKDEVAVEGRIELYVNDERYAVFSCSPSQIKEMVIGHLLTEGIISKVKEIKKLEISPARADVHLTKRTKLGLSAKPRFISTLCGNGSPKIQPRVWMKMKRVKGNDMLRLRPQAIFGAVEALNSRAVVFRRSGGTHASALLDEEGRVLAFSEDIGRHNAIDKVVGKAALEDIDFTRTLLASTGRLTSEMVIKIVNVDISVAVSISAPTDKGIKIAEMAGLTLIGFVRGRRFNVYTCPERIVT
jgi:FdhD protein